MNDVALRPALFLAAAPQENTFFSLLEHSKSAIRILSDLVELNQWKCGDVVVHKI
jgi:hypothetical protein